jgi:hypothetical protein
MTTTIRHRRRWRAGIAAAAGIALIAGGTAVANAATAPRPAIGFVVATKTVILEKHIFRAKDGSIMYSYVDGDLGTYLVAGNDPFEIRVKRKSYKDPIVANQVVLKKGKRTNVRLPAGMVTDFRGLKKFSTVTIKNAAGTTLSKTTSDFCPSVDWNSSRTRPDAPDSSPYPRQCGDNPFLLGNVWGIQAGWTSSVVRSNALDAVPDGAYKATITIAKRYRDFFKIPGATATANLAVTVKTVEDRIVDEEEGGAANATAASPAAAAARSRALTATNPGADHSHLTEGDPSLQASMFSADLRPPARRPAAMAVAKVPAGPRPDLRSLPAWNVMMSNGTTPDNKPDGKTYIVFSATVWNGGTSPLVVDGFRRTGTELMDAYQYFYDAKGKQVGSTSAGTFQWDKREGHKHWHFTDFAQYRLLGANKKLVVKSGKEAFCLANTDAVDTTIPNAKWNPSNTDLSSSCGANTAVAVREVLDIGGGDTYQQYLPGQSFDITGLKNGTYYIEVLANPSKKLSELSTSNNSALRKVILSGAGAKRKLTVPAVYGLDGPFAQAAT